MSIGEIFLKSIVRISRSVAWITLLFVQPNAYSECKLNISCGIPIVPADIDWKSGIEKYSIYKIIPSA